MTGSDPHIGTLREKHLHAALKEWCSEPGDRIEEAIDGFVIDLVRGDLLIEIQTRGFSSMKRKVTSLLDSGHRLRIVHPIAVDRTIVKMDDDGEVLDRRMSPKHGSLIDICGELVSFPDLLRGPGLEIEAVLTVQDEIRRHEEGKAWRRKGWVVVERHLVEVLGTELFRGPDDLIALLPEDMGDPFTTSEVAEALGSSMRVAQQLAYCLRHAGVVEAVGKRGRSVEYRKV